MSNQTLFPAFPLSEWIKTKGTLHRYLQIVGKLRLSLMPKQNHWWHVTLFVTSSGVSTGPIPTENFTFKVEFDFINHQLNVRTSKGKHRFFGLKDGLSVADFYHHLKDILSELEIKFDIIAEPFDMSDNIPFAECVQHNSYDSEAVHKAWKILVEVDMILKEFKGKSYSKTCPSQIYWHHFDLVVSRFSGRRAPKMDTTSQVELQAYSHEMISFGFWFGDETIKEPAFYSYTYPSPQNINQEPLLPKTAKWVDSNGSPMALLLYKDIIKSENPKQNILDFLQTSYEAGAKLANWDIEALQIN